MAISLRTRKTTEPLHFGHSASDGEVFDAVTDLPVDDTAVFMVFLSWSFVEARQPKHIRLLTGVVGDMNQYGKNVDRRTTRSKLVHLACGRNAQKQAFIHSSVLLK